MGGGKENSSDGNQGVISGGNGNLIFAKDEDNDLFSSINGGVDNLIDKTEFSVITGGNNNTIRQQPVLIPSVGTEQGTVSGKFINRIVVNYRNVEIDLFIASQQSSLLLFFTHTPLVITFLTHFLNWLIFYLILHPNPLFIFASWFFLLLCTVFIIGGNSNNILNGRGNVITGGDGNTLNSITDSVITGGKSNKVDRDNAFGAVVVGGLNNEASGVFSIAFGTNAFADTANSMATNLSGNSAGKINPIRTTSPGQFLIQAKSYKFQIGNGKNNNGDVSSTILSKDNIQKLISALEF